MMNLVATSRKKTEVMFQLRGYLSRFQFLRECASEETVRQRHPVFCREDGASLVEFALSASVLFMMLIGILQISLALYTYNYVCDASREATRYAVVRGAQSCTISKTFPDCNLLPSDVTSATNPASNPLLAYIENLGYPGMNPANLSANVTWWSSNVTQGGAGGFSTTDWNTQCTGTDLNAQPCNTPGDAVQVVVTYAFPLNIPFLNNATINLTSTSKMVINE